jgi:hypothetical protein
MPLALPTGDSQPYIKFLPSGNSWQMSSEAGSVEFDFSKPAVFDVQKVQLGWLWLAEGQRDWQPWPNNVQTPKPAEGEYKAGFEMLVYSTVLFGEDQVRMFAASGTGSVMFIQALYNEAEKCPEFKEGMVPVVKINGSKPLKVGKGNTRVPQFEIVKWVARPTVLGELTPAPAPAAKPAATKPATKPAEPDMPPAGDDEF